MATTDGSLPAVLIFDGAPKPTSLHCLGTSEAESQAGRRTDPWDVTTVDVEVDIPLCSTVQLADDREVDQLYITETQSMLQCADEARMSTIVPESMSPLRVMLSRHSDTSQESSSPSIALPSLFVSQASAHIQGPVRLLTTSPRPQDMSMPSSKKMKLTSDPAPSTPPTDVIEWSLPRPFVKLQDCISRTHDAVEVICTVLRVEPAIFVETKRGACPLLTIYVGDPSHQLFPLSVWGVAVVTTENLLRPGCIVRISGLKIDSYQGRSCGVVLSSARMLSLSPDLINKSESIWPAWTKTVVQIIKALAQWNSNRHLGVVTKTSFQYAKSDQLEYIEGGVVSIRVLVLGQIYTYGSASRRTFIVADTPSNVLDLVVWTCLGNSLDCKVWNALLGASQYTSSEHVNINGKEKLKLLAVDLQRMVVKRCSVSGRLQLHTRPGCMIHLLDPNSDSAEIVGRLFDTFNPVTSPVQQICSRDFRSIKDGMFKLRASILNMKIGSIRISYDSSRESLIYISNDSVVPSKCVWEQLLFRGCTHCGSMSRRDHNGLPISCQRKECFKKGILSECQWLQSGQVTAILEDNQDSIEMLLRDRNKKKYRDSSNTTIISGDRQMKSFFKSVFEEMIRNNYFEPNCPGFEDQEWSTNLMNDACKWLFKAGYIDLQVVQCSERDIHGVIVSHELILQSII